MSSLLAKIMLAIFLLPSAAMVMLVTWFVVEQQTWFTYPFASFVELSTAGICTWTFVAVYWVLLWRRSVRWTARRRVRTVLAAGIAALVGGCFWFCLTRLDDSFALFVFYTVTILVWLPLSVMVWKESAAERRERLDVTSAALTCPTCGYNLTGLTAARCPECGTSFTLDELISSQHNREQAELQA